MVITDSLFSVSQGFFSPDIVEKISNEIHQPVDRTKAGLRSIIPTLLIGIVEKGSTTEGAESLANLARKQNIHPELMINEMSPRQGNEMVHGIFGNNLSAVVSRLCTSTGMSTVTIMKILSLSAPIMMGVIGLKIKAEKLGASGLMTFLGQQRLTELSYEELNMKTAHEERVTIWKKIAFTALIIVALTWWFSSEQGSVNAPTTNVVTVHSI